MQFDNKHFENNVANTMSTLDKFKQKLNLTGATKGLENVDTAARRLDMSGLGNAVETVQAKFSALGVIGVTALANITNSAVNAGKRMISALTIDPIKTGFSEYETKINAIQTIMSNTASKGTTMEDVTRVIGELNTYADKTIYNFAEMTRNIGTFTAAGVGLEESATAIQGIANLAAVSGSTSQQASTAMYQLSQAMASGTVKLMDWNSVVNAGMGGQVFQDALKNTAKAHGVAVDDIIKKHGSFRESLTEGWITTEILTETLAKMTKGGAAEYLSELTGVELKQIEAAQKLVEENKDGSASYEELAEQLSATGKISKDEAMNILKMADNAENAATKVKTFTQLWDTLKESAQSGWSQTWEILVGDFEEAKETLTKISDVIGGMISASADARNELLQGWKDAGGRGHLVDSLFNLIKAFTSIVTPIKEAFSEIFPPLTVKQLLSFTEGIKNLTSKLILGEETADKLKRTFKGVFAIFDIVKQVVGALFKAISPLFGKVDDLGGGILGITAKMGDWLVKLSESIEASGFFTKAVEKIHAAIEKVKNFLQPVIEGFKKFGNEVSKNLTAVADNAQERLGPLTVLGNFIMGIFAAVGKTIAKVFPYVTKAASGIGKVFGDLFSRISDSIQNADYDSFFDLMSGGIIATIGAFIAKFIKSGGDLLDNAGGFLENINGILSGVGDALGAFTESLKADTLKKIATAIGILAVSLLVLSLIPSEQLTSALVAITTLFGELMGSMAIFSKMGDMKGIAKIATAMISLSAALLILSIALKIMSTMSWGEMGVGLISLTVGIGLMTGAVNLLPDKKVDSAAKAIKKMSSALLILAIAIKIMSTMSWEEMGVGLITMVVGLGALVGAVNLLPKDTAARAAGLVGMATAMVILGAALKIMATMSWEEIARGLVALGGSLLILVGALALMKSAIPGALAMMIVAPALVILAGALTLLSNLSWEEIARGLVALGGSLLIMAGAMFLMKSAIPGALAMIIMAAALAVLTPVLMLLGSMSLAEIGKSLLMLAGVFAVFGVAGLLLSPLVGTFLALAGAIALFGLAMVGIGAGVLMLGAGITMLAAAVAASGGAISVFIASIISLIPFLIEQVGLGIIKLCQVIAGSGAAICDALAVLIVAAVDAIVAAVPALVEGVLVLIVSLLESLVSHLPTIVGLLVDLLVSLLASLASHIPTLVESLVQFFIVLLEALAANVGSLIEPLIAFWSAIFQGIADAIGPIIETIIVPLLGTLLDAIVGLIEAIAPYIPNIQAMLTTICAAFVALAQQIAPIIQSITGLVRQLGNTISQILYSVAAVIQSIAITISVALQGLANVFSTIFNGIATVISAVGQSINTILQGIADVVTSVGEAIATALEGLADTFDSVFNGIAEVITAVGDSIQSVLEGIADVIDSIGEAALNAGTGFENLANGVKTITKLDLADMTASLTAVAVAVGDIATHSSEINKVGKGMEKLTNAIATVPSSVDKFVSAFTNASVTMQSFGTDTINNIVKGINSQKKNLVASAKDAMTQFVNALKKQQSTVKSTCKQIVSSAAEAISGKSSSFKSAGKDLGSGLVLGIKSKKTAVYNAAYALGQAAVQGEKDGQKSNSPSKLTILAGKWLGEGLVIGMEKMGNSVYRAGSELGKTATGTISSSISRIADMVSTDIDSQPTIRPVLDLSDVKTGAAAIDGMFNSGAMLGVTANVGAVNSMMNRRIQNRVSNGDVISAINKLGENLGNSRGDTYQINGVTYDDGSNIASAVKDIVRAARIERRA
jgi:tape measure domain-containing protein